MSEERGDLIPSTQPVDTLQAATPSQALMFDPTKPQRLSWCSWDRKTEEGYLLISRVGADDKKQLSKLANMEIEVEHFYVQPNESKPDEHGEVKQYPWICLVSPDGTLYSCGSRGVLASLSEAMEFRPQLPWKPALRFRVVNIPFGDKHHIMKLLAVKGRPIEVEASNGRKKN